MAWKLPAKIGTVCLKVEELLGTRSQRQVKTFEECLKANQYILMKVPAA